MRQINKETNITKEMDQQNLKYVEEAESQQGVNKKVSQWNNRMKQHILQKT